MSNIYHLIDRLERLLNESWQVPLSTYLVINEDDFLDVIDQMRTSIPQEIRQAERVHQERDRIIAQAEEEAHRIVQLAQEEAARLVEEHEIIRLADQRGQTIIQRAQREASNLKQEADQYAREVLSSLDEQLGVVQEQIAALMRTVRNGLEALSHAEESVEEL